MFSRNPLLLAAALTAGWVAVSAPALAQLTLNVNRDTGATSITNSTGATVDIDAYSLVSDNGLLAPLAWNSLQDQAEPDWQEVNTATANELGELNPLTSTSLVDGSNTSIGLAYTTSTAVVDAAMAAVGFGNGFEDVVFQYNAVGSPAAEFGNVVFEGTQRFNDLVLDVDATSGNVTLTNESSLTVTIDAYSITSADGMLSVGWNGLRDTESEWVGGNPGSSDSPSGLAEFTTSETFSIAGGSSFDLGTAFNPAFNPAVNPAVEVEDLDLVFEFLIVGEEPFETGVVRYANTGSGADADGDGDIDGADFLLLQRTNPGGIPDWQANYPSPLGGFSASAAAVPEPSSLGLLVLGLCCTTMLTRRA